MSEILRIFVLNLQTMPNSINIEVVKNDIIENFNTEISDFSDFLIMYDEFKFKEELSNLR